MFIYLIRTGPHVHYVGVSKNVKVRKRMHKGMRGHPGVRIALANGAEIVPFKVVPYDRAYFEEGRLIRWYKNYGMCECNINIPTGRTRVRMRLAA